MNQSCEHGYLAKENDGKYHCQACGVVVETASPVEPRAEPDPRAVLWKINDEPDYIVQCRCGWKGHASTLKSLPNFKHGCPECSTEFIKIFATQPIVSHGLGTVTAADEAYLKGETDSL